MTVVSTKRRKEKRREEKRREEKRREEKRREEKRREEEEEEEKNSVLHVGGNILISPRATLPKAFIGRPSHLGAPPTTSTPEPQK